MSLQLFGNDGLIPHGSCLLWFSPLFWTHATADALIALAYYSIGAALLVIALKRRELLFRGTSLLFAAFILACATCHVFDVWTLWHPDYGSQAVVKIVTAVISVATAAIMWPLLPHVVALPSIGQLEATNGALNAEIAERRQAQAALALYAKELEASNLRLEGTLQNLDMARRQLVQSEKMASLGRLVAGIAHEINTPIGNGVTISTSLTEVVRRFRAALQNGVLMRSVLDGFTEDVDEAARLLTSNLANAAELVQSFKQVAADQASSQRRQFDLRETVEEVIATLRPRYKHTAHKIEIRIRPGILMDSYPGPLGQVVTNLVTNSLVHAFADGDLGHITLTARQREDGRIDILYRDDGSGIPPELRNQVFEPFFTTRQGQGGTGLGLHVVYNIVTNVLGGHISLAPQPDAGTAFALELPATAPTLPRANGQS